MRFSRSLKENKLFRRLYAKGTSAANGYLVLYCRKNGLGENRIGYTVSKKLGHAVVRNRVRRRPGYDLVVVARGRAVNASYAKLERSMLSLASQLGVRSEKGDHPETFAD